MSQHLLNVFQVCLAMIICIGCGSDNHTTAVQDHKVNGIFRDATQQVGLTFTHDAAVEGRYAMPESLAPGAAFLDFDNDGDLDIYFINAAYRDPQKRQEKKPINRLYRQEADGTFTDVTVASGLGDPEYGMGVAVGDINNDGYVDVYITNYSFDTLYRNNGDGTFSNISREANISNERWGCSATFLDYDLDGYLDIYVTNYVAYDSAFHCPDAAGRPEYCGPKAFPGSPDVLYKNNGDGTFSDVSRQSGIDKFVYAGLGVVTADFNHDHYPDIYVANDEDPNLLFLNQRDGTFQEQAISMGAAFNQLGRVEAGMGIAIGDTDNNGEIDLFITHLQGESNTMYRRSAEFGFEDRSVMSGFEKPDLISYTGFGTGFLDLDHDGDLDLAVANGRIRRGPILTKTRPEEYWAPYAEPNLLFENNGQGLFRDISSKDNAFTTRVGNSRGLAFGDVDNDGDVDLLLMDTGHPARLFMNDLPEKGNWLTVNAFDQSLNRQVIGAQITLVADTLRLIRLISPAYSYLCSNDPRAHFGLGKATAVEQIMIQWPGGPLETFPGVKANQFVTLKKGEGTTH